MTPFSKSFQVSLFISVTVLFIVGGIGHLPVLAQGEEDCAKEIRAFTHIIIDSPIFKAYLLKEDEIQDIIPMVSKLAIFLERELTEEEYENLLKISDQAWKHIQGKGYFEDLLVEPFSLLSCEEVMLGLEFFRTLDGQRYLFNQDEEMLDQLDEFQNPLEEKMLEAFSVNFKRKVRGFRIPSGAMLPTLWVGDNIWVDLTHYKTHDPHRKDVIVFKYPKDETKTFVKRIIGMPGDKILIKKKMVFVNEALLNEEGYTQRIDPGIIDGQINSRDSFGPIMVPSDSYFVLGDNRDQSLDSRFWGFVKREKILGKAEFIYFSIDNPTKEIFWERSWKAIE